MASVILSTNSICAQHYNCDQFRITDKVNWATESQNAANAGSTDPGIPWSVPSSNIIQTDVSITFDGVTTDFTTASYVSPYIITPTDLNMTDSLSDGVYKVSVTYTSAYDTFTYEFYALLTCVLDCKIDQLTLEIISEDCSACDDKTDLLYCILAYRHGLNSSFTCNNFAQTENILEWLNNLLVNFNCNNC